MRILIFCTALTIMHHPAVAEIPLRHDMETAARMERTFPPDKFIGKYQPDPVSSSTRIPHETTEQELGRLLHRYRGRLQMMMQDHTATLSAVHHWEHGARIDVSLTGETRWINLGSSKGTRNRTCMRLTNQTRVCIHVHPEDSVPWPGFNDRMAARQARQSLCMRCRHSGLADPPPVWMVTVHASGQVWAWKEGMPEPIRIGEHLSPVTSSTRAFSQPCSMGR